MRRLPRHSRRDRHQPGRPSWRPWLALFVAALASVFVIAETQAQDLEPREFANTPVGLNFLIGGYAYSEGTVGTDATIPLDDVEVSLNSAVLAYVRVLDLWGRSGKVNVVLPYSWASGSASLAGQQRERSVSGFGDPRLRISMLLHGGPSLSLAEFKDYEADLVIGVSFEVTAPLGQYDEDKLLNIGTNRWSFKSEIGGSKTVGPLTLELSAGSRFYTDNTDFLGGRTLQVDPLYSVQSHLIVSLNSGVWAGLDGLYYTGGRPDIDGNEGEANENARVGLTLAIPLNRHSSIKLYGSKGVYAKTGSDFDILGVALQYRWGAGL